MRHRLRHRRLRQELDRRDVSQNRWAQMLGLSKSHLSMLVNGKRPYPTRATRDKLVEGLGIATEELFVLEGPPSLPDDEPLTMDALLQDLLHAWRALRRRPAFAGLIVLTLALGIGATTAIASVVDATLLRPLPFEEPERLVRLFGVNPQYGITRGQMSMANVIDLRERGRSFESLATYRGRTFNLVGGGEPERTLGLLVADGFLEMIGREPILGRTFTADEHRAGGAAVALLSDRIWRDRFEADRRVLGRTIRIDTTEHTIVGVLPPDFADVNLLLGWQDGAPDLVMPLAVEAGVDRAAYWQLGLGRLASGVELDAAQAEVDGIVEELAAAYPQDLAGHEVALVPLHEAVAGDVRTTLLLFLGSVAAVLCIGCVNVANLMTVYAESRHQETAVRKALGAGRVRLARLSLLECLLLSGAGGAVGLGLAALALGAARPLLPDAILRPELVGVDPRIFAFATALSVLVALLFGVAPTVSATRATPRGELPAASSTSIHPRRMRALRGLVVAQLALAGVVTIGSGLLVKSYARLTAVEPGFETEGLLSFYTIPRYNFATAQERNGFVTDLLRALERLPGVESVGEVNFLPFTDNEAGQGIDIEGKPTSDGTQRSAWLRAVDDGFFPTLGVRMLEGRGFERADMLDGGVAVINRTMADRYWPDGDALGARFQAGGDTWYRIVGIAPDLKWHALDDGPAARFYLPYPDDPFSTRGFVLRTRGEPTALADAVRAAVWAIEPDQSLFDIQTMQQRLHASVAPTRFSLVTLLAFTGVALALALVGTYAVFSWVVGRRTAEIGLRLALGARSTQVRGMLLRQTVVLATLATALALLGSRLLAGSVSAYLFEVAPGDPTVLLPIVALLVGAALLATWVPARRAARIDPARALRE